METNKKLNIIALTAWHFPIHSRQRLTPCPTFNAFILNAHTQTQDSEKYYINTFILSHWPFCKPYNAFICSCRWHNARWIFKHMHYHVIIKPRKKRVIFNAESTTCHIFLLIRHFWFIRFTEFKIKWFFMFADLNFSKLNFDMENARNCERSDTIKWSINLISNLFLICIQLILIMFHCRNLSIF